MNDPVSDKLRPPEDTPEYMWPAWGSCLHAALGHHETLAAFRAATGNTWSPDVTAIEKMIDQGTGADRAFLEAFVTWFNENVWGRFQETPT